MTKISLKRNIAFSTGSQIITMIASFVVNWFLARYLGPELRGKYVYLFTVNTVVWTLLDLGMSKSMIFSLQHDKADPNKLYSYVLVFFAFALLLSMPVLYLWGDRLLGNQGFSYPLPVLLALGVYIVAFLMFNRLKFIFMGVNLIRDYAALNLMPSLLFMLVLLPTYHLFPADSKMQDSYLLNVGIMLAVILFFHLRLIRRISFRFVWDKVLILRSYSLGFKAFLSEYLIILMTRMDIIILKSLGSFAQLGVYTLAINFLDMINIMAGMIGFVLLNHFSALKDDFASLNILRKIFVIMLLFDFICIGGMALIGLPVIKLLYGIEYQNSWYAFMYLIPAILGLTLGGLFNTFLWSKGFPVFTIVAPAIATGLKVILANLLIRRYGIFGASISSSIIYPLWFGLLLVWYFGHHRDQKPSCLLVRKDDIRQIVDMIRVLKQKLAGQKEA